MKQCKMCGKDITYLVGKNVGNLKYCKECAAKSKAQSMAAHNTEQYQKEKSENAYKKYIKQYGDNMARIMADVVEAEKLGMSYGQYEAMQYERKQKKRRQK